MCSQCDHLCACVMTTWATECVEGPSHDRSGMPRAADVVNGSLFEEVHGPHKTAIFLLERLLESEYRTLDPLQVSLSF